MSTTRTIAASFVLGATIGGGGATAIAQPRVTETAVEAHVERTPGVEAATSGCTSTITYERVDDEGVSLGMCLRWHDTCAPDLGRPSAPVLIDKCPAKG